ncbi:MAG: hypothetical protein HY961_08325 [Ignavibacteriae bacterium]|nr:hypothetical protein [Ignavibacteriota bacterium]
MMEILDNQLRDGNPKETKETYQRLKRLGIEEEEVRRQLACVIAAEMFNVLKFKEPYNEKRFVERLKLLPEMPWMEEDEE